MPLPNPTYLTIELFDWNEFSTPAVLVVNDITILGTKRTIRWDACDVYDKKMVHDLIMGYATVTGLTEATALTGFIPAPAYQIINYHNSIVASNPVTGLVNGKTYTAYAVVNGVEIPISIVASGTDTYAQLLGKLQTSLGVNATIQIINGNFEVQTPASGLGQIVEIFDHDLFVSLPGFKEFEEIRVGVSSIGEIFDSNMRKNYQTYSSLIVGKLRSITNKISRSANSSNDIYYNQGTLAWLFTATDTTTPI